MFCHVLPRRTNDLPNVGEIFQNFDRFGECRKRCTVVKVWTEWCGCGVNEICEPIGPTQSKFAGMGSGICKLPRYGFSYFIEKDKNAFNELIKELYLTCYQRYRI